MLISPLKVPLNKQGSRYFTLNLNYYRNAHYQKLNNAKIAYKKIMKAQIDSLEPMNKIELIYHVYLPTKRKIDISNIVSITDKFFCDALVEAGKIPDDNYEHLGKITMEFKGIDKTNPRIEIYIKEVKDENHNE